jgi:hypothetical protein
MKERPILFSGAMVRALLAGTKTQTRRVMNQQPIPSSMPGKWQWVPPARFRREHSMSDFGYIEFKDRSSSIAACCPYGSPGDRLWVRETWAYGIHAVASARDEDGPFVYAAHGTTQGRLCDRWRPSIHMPRYACRIVLEIVSVRIERLNDICGNDCIAEGAWREEDKALGRSTEAIEAFSSLWQSINGQGSWDANPWVWVIEFKRVGGGAA